jgi:hypothetical protein
MIKPLPLPDTKIFFFSFLFLLIWITNVNAQSTGDYRTKKSGLWTDISVWETFKNSVWINATHYPAYQDKVVTILDDTVTIQGISLDLDQVVINNGLLYLKQHSILHLRNANGNDLINNGTINIFNSTVDLKDDAVLLNDLQGTILFQLGDTILGYGRINNKNALKLFTALPLLDSVVFNQSSGTISGTGNISIAGTINISSADIKTPVTILKRAVLNINKGDSKKISNITNDGIINWNTGNVSFYSGTIFTNNGQVNIYDEGSLLSAGQTVAKLINTSKGKIEKFADARYGLTRIAMDIDNFGSIIIHKGILNTTGVFHDSHVFNLSGVAWFENYGHFYADSSEVLNGSGSFYNYKTAIINYIDTLPKNLRFYNDGNLEGTGQLFVQNYFGLSGLCSIPITIMDSGRCDFNAVNLFAPFINNGLTKFNSGAHRINADFVNNNRVELVSENFNIQAGSHVARFINKGKMVGYDKGYPYSLETHIPFFNTDKGSIEGIGVYVFKDSLINEGSINPGFDYTGRTITFASNPFQTTSKANIRIGKNSGQKTLADNIFVREGTTILGGTLNLYQTSETVDTGYYTIIRTFNSHDYPGFIGTFSTINKPDNWDVIYTDITIRVHVKAASAELPVTLNTSAYTVSTNSKFETASVFPNPANAAITIQFNVMKEGAYDVELFDMAGKPLLHKQGISINGTNKINIDVSRYLPGAYVVNINAGGQNRILKFIKE